MKPAAYLTRNPDGDPAMLFFDKDEAADYCDDGETPEPLFKADEIKTELLEIAACSLEPRARAIVSRMLRGLP